MSDIKYIKIPEFMKIYLFYPDILETAISNDHFQTIEYIHNNKLVDTDEFVDHLNWAIAFLGPEDNMVKFLQKLGYKENKEEVEELIRKGDE